MNIAVIVKGKGDDVILMSSRVFRRLSLKRKAAIFVSVILVLMVTSAGSVYFELQKNAYNVQHINLIGKQRMWIDYMAALIPDALENDKDAKEQLRKVLYKFEDTMHILENGGYEGEDYIYPVSPELQGHVVSLRTLWDLAKADLIRVLDPEYSWDSFFGDYQAWQGYEPGQYYLAQTEILAEHIEALSRAEQDQTINAMNNVIRVVFLNLGFGLLVLALASYVFRKGILDPLSELEGTTRKITREGDLSVTIPKIDNRDEIGSLARSFDTMTTNFSNLLVKIELLNEAAGSINASLNPEEVLENLHVILNRELVIEEMFIILPSREREEVLAGFPVNRRPVAGPYHILPLRVGEKIIAHWYIGLGKSDGEMASSILEPIADYLALSVNNTLLYRSVESAYVDNLRSLAAAIDAKDYYTHYHSSNVSRYSGIIARKMGFTDSFVGRVEAAGLLHDIGKIAVPESILNKKGSLNEHERYLMQQHPVKGAEIINKTPVLADLKAGLLYHHERWDGKGYPEGLIGEQIPLEARIIGLADALDAMTSDRPYKKGKSVKEAIEDLESNSGAQFSPKVVRAAVIALKDGDLIIDQNI